MSTFTYSLAIIVMALVAIVLVRGLFNMMKGGDANLSNKLNHQTKLKQMDAEDCHVQQSFLNFLKNPLKK